MPQVTEATRENIVRLFTIPAMQKDGDGREWLPDVTVWAWWGDRHEETGQGPQLPTKVWWEGMKLRADVGVSMPNADAIEFRYGKKTVWVQAIRAGNRRKFTFAQDFPAGRPKISWLQG